MVTWVSVSAVMMMVMMSRVRSSTALREWIWWKAEHVEWRWPVVRWFVVVMVMVMVRMHMMMVVCRVTRFRLLRSALSIWRSCPVDAIFVTRTSAILLASATNLTTRSSFLMYLGHSGAHKITAFYMTRRSHPRWRCSAVHRLTSVWSCCSNATSKPREHTTKLALDAGIVTPRCYMPRLGSLHSLWKWRVPALTIEFGADIEQSAMSGAITLLALCISKLCLQSLVLLKGHWSLWKAIATALEGVQL